MLSPDDLQRCAQQYYQHVYLFCLSKLQNKEDAKDVTQSVFLQLQTNQEILHDKNLLAWLYAVADNKVKECFRQRQKTACCSLDDDTCRQADILYADKPELLQTNMTEADIDKAKTEILEQLTEDERRLFHWVYDDGLSYQHIAQRLGISSNAAYVRAHRMRKKIIQLVSMFFLLFYLLL